MGLSVQENVPLAPLTTFELGGPARWFARAVDRETVIQAFRWARDRDLDVLVLGGGSNLVVADDGIDALVLQVAIGGVRTEPRGERVRLVVGAGEPWDPLVARTVADDLAGLECLSGIPGSVGATPIQNVGAYGQEVAETITSVTVLDRTSLEIEELDPDRCGFDYRNSFFKRNPDRYVVLEVTYELEAGGPPAVRYGELERALRDEPSPTLAEVRDTVLRLRRAKSMVIDPDDENRRCAGSFFTNPILPEGEAERVVDQSVHEGIVTDAASVPRWPAGDGRTKLAAGWLIERAGIHKGYRRGNVGISTKHALALVHHGGGTTAELLDLARHVRDTVRTRFGVELVPEPVIVGTAF